MPHPSPPPEDAMLTRREALCRAGMGFGALALSGLMAEAGLLAAPARGAEATTPLVFRSPPVGPRARRVIPLSMNGGPSQVDTFDPKPALTRQAGKPLP